MDGSFGNEQRAVRRLAVIVPVTCCSSSSVFTTFDSGGWQPDLVNVSMRGQAHSRAAAVGAEPVGGRAGRLRGVVRHLDPEPGHPRGTHPRLRHLGHNLADAFGRAQCLASTMMMRP